MSTFGNICGTGPSWPDVGNSEVPCCDGSAMFGPGRCTCWEPVYDLEQQPLQRGADAGTRDTKCVDCAYRPGSPERAGDPAAAADHEALLALARSGQTFWCHQGMRRPSRWRHPTSGVEIDGSTLNYEPPIADGKPWKADGTPGDLCAGWAAIRAREVSG